MNSIAYGFSKPAEHSGSKILGVGNPFLDRSGHVDFLPDGLKKGDTDVVFERKIAEQYWTKAFGVGSYNWSLGGSCTNVIKSLSRLISGSNLNFSCALMGMAGKDKKQEIEQKLASFGVEPLLRQGVNDNGFVNCFVTPPDSQRTMQTFLGASLEFSEEYISPNCFKNVFHVHLEGYLAYFNGVLEKSIKLAKENGSTVSLDLSSIDVISKYRDRLKQCAAKVDIIFGNYQEMEEFTECKDTSEMIKKFHSRQTVVITTGSQGGWVKPTEKDEILPFEALEISKVIDTTGAGDFFIAGFLTGFLTKQNIENCIEIAKLAASHIIQHDGTDLPEKDWDELRKQIGVKNAEGNI